MFGFQAAGAAPIVKGAPVLSPVTIATAIRIGNPASWRFAEQARDESGGLIDAVTDKQILEAYRMVARSEAVFVEPASAASVAGLLMTAADGRLPRRRDGRLHRDRQRAEGSGVGDRRRAAPDHRAGRRARGGREPRAGMSTRFRDGPVRVRMPATSANLGPGYDSFGLALGIFDDLSARVVPDGLHVEVAGEGERLARDETHLVVRAMRATFERLGGQPDGLQLRCVNRIPHGRGLGSSAAAIVGGVVLARALVLDGPQTMPDDAVFALAAGLEGHPDNVAACLFGGLTMAWSEAGRVRAARVQVDPAVHPVVLVAPFESSTAATRGLLPPTVPHADAACVAARAGLLVAVLSGAVPGRGSACSRPPRTACTSPTALRRCPRPRSWCAGCAPTGSPRWSPAPARPCSCWLEIRSRSSRCARWRPRWRLTGGCSSPRWLPRRPRRAGGAGGAGHAGGADGGRHRGPRRGAASRATRRRVLPAPSRPQPGE